MYDFAPSRKIIRRPASGVEALPFSIGRRLPEGIRNQIQTAVNSTISAAVEMVEAPDKSGGARGATMGEPPAD